MCKLRRKLLMFDYTVGKLVEWDTNRKLEDLSIDNINKSLANFSSVRLMKLLYFICLQSVIEKGELLESRTENGKEITLYDRLDLFDLFDNFVALPMGPAEDDVYSNRTSLLRYRYNEETKRLQITGKYLEDLKFIYKGISAECYKDFKTNEILDDFISKADAEKDDDEVELSVFIRKLDKAIENLKVTFSHKNIFFDCVQMLIDLTHKLPLWNYYIRSENSKYSLTEEEKQKEAINFAAM